MNMTANFKRASTMCLIAVSWLALVACSNVATDIDMVEPNDIPESMPESIAQNDSEDIFASNEILPEPSLLLPSVDGNIGVELLSDDDFDRFVLMTEAEGAEYRVTRLSAPARIVVDILNGQNRLNRVLPAEESTYVRSVRIGAHPDKSRVVFDLNLPEGLAHNVSSDAGDVFVTISREDQLLNVLARLDNAAPASDMMMASAGDEIFEAEQDAGFDQVDAMEPIEAQQEAGIESVAIEEDIAIDDSPVVQAAFEETKNASAALKSLAIQPAGNNNNMLVAEMNAAGFFTFEKTAQSEYVLTLENAAFDPNKVQTVLAPAGSGAIRSVRPISQGQNTLLRIFAAPQVDLKARVQQGNILVESSPLGEFAANNDGDMMAQMEDNDAGDNAEASENGGNNLAEEIAGALLEEEPKYTGRLISLDLQDTDIDNALRIIAEVSNLNIIASDDVTGKVTLRLIDVPWDQALDVILKTNGLDKVQEGNVVRIAPVEKLRLEREALKQAQEAEEDLEPLAVRYIRISYARAADLQPLVDTVISERGTVAYDERTNQIIVKDIRRGIRNVAQLIKKLDLRTPQVLLETQIVEAQRTLLRDLGSEVGFSHIQSPATGNATGENFPNSIGIGGSLVPGDNTGSSFPAAVDLTGGAAVSLLLDSADGAYSLSARLSALESDGRVRIVSRPAVATTNNQQAVIKSVEKIRVKTPQGGLSVATGQGASAAGSGGVATETIEIGIILEVTPQASPDYYVLLDINAKSSTLGSTEVDGIPSEVERSATSTVLVSSGQTFAMGGIYKISDSTLVSGVPFLKDIPFLGHFFRNQGVNNSDEELIFFITPRIVEGSFDDAAMRVSS